DILSNVIPFIDGEEHKVETEPKKILGCLRGNRVDPHPAKMSAQTARVGVLNGHTESVSVALEQHPTPEALIDAWGAFKGKPQLKELPSAPAQPVVYLTERNR